MKAHEPLGAMGGMRRHVATATELPAAAGSAAPSAPKTAAARRPAARRRRAGRRRRGAAAVEFAIVAPLFLMLVFGMIEFGRMVMVQQVITNASREGARRGVVDGATTSDVQTVVRDYLQSCAVSQADIEVTPDPPSSAGFGQPVKVTVDVAFNEVSWLPSPFFLADAKLSATTVMRREAIP